MCLHTALRSRTTFFVSQLALLAFSLLYIPARLYPQFHPDLLDGVRGCFLGIAIGTVIVTARRNRGHSA